MPGSRASHYASSGRSPTGRCTDRAFRAEADEPGSTRATAPSPSSSPTALCSGGARSTTLIAQLVAAAAAKLDPALLDALRLGVYQLLYLDGVPDHAAVRASPSTCSKAGQARRRPARERGACAASRARAARRSTRSPTRRRRVRRAMHSHPDWLARMWWDQLGPDAAARAARRATTSRPRARCE